MSIALRTLQLCERFGCLPSRLYAEDSALLQMLEMERMVTDGRGE